MDTTEDGLCPVGEDDPFGGTLGAIQRGAVLGILSTSDEVVATKQLAERQARVLREVWEMCECYSQSPLARSVLAVLAREAL
ncbi:hypothetical protein [Mycolicibacterium sp.]|uniref:hypothetical protein n=1 Tax=Mycolicibacterium sp. TaxID=2320850 RepID=UPI00355D0799